MGISLRKKNVKYIVGIKDLFYCFINFLKAEYERNDLILQSESTRIRLLCKALNLKIENTLIHIHICTDLFAKLPTAIERHLMQEYINAGNQMEHMLWRPCIGAYINKHWYFLSSPNSGNWARNAGLNEAAVKCLLRLRARQHSADTRTISTLLARLVPPATRPC